MRKFKLLKDYSTPKCSISAGTVFRHKDGIYYYEKDGIYYYEIGANGIVFTNITSDVIENTPDWFEEITEPRVTRGDFKWKDGKPEWVESDKGKIMLSINEPITLQQTQYRTEDLYFGINIPSVIDVVGNFKSMTYKLVSPTKGVITIE